MKSILIIALLFLCFNFVLSTTHTIADAGLAFNPSTLTIASGDTVNFVLGSLHDAVEVSQMTWNANGTTSNGGFQVPFGGGKVVSLQPGTHYYVCTNHVTLGMKGTITVNSVTNAQGLETNQPTSFKLNQNYPNPFNPSTSISYTVPEQSYVTLKIFNLLGVEVQSLVDGLVGPGNHGAIWDGSKQSSGVYFYQLKAKGVSNNSGQSFTETKRLLLLK